jgi:hypothetical protein
MAHQGYLAFTLEDDSPVGGSLDRACASAREALKQTRRANEGAPERFRCAFRRSDDTA